MTDSCSMLYCMVKEGIHPAGFSIWMGLQVLIKKTLTFLNVNLIHITSLSTSSDFPPLEWIRRVLVYLDSIGKEFNICPSQGNSCSTDKGKAFEIMCLGSSPDFMVNQWGNNGQFLFMFLPLCFPSPIFYWLLEFTEAVPYCALRSISFLMPSAEESFIGNTVQNICHCNLKNFWMN